MCEVLFLICLFSFCCLLNPDRCGFSVCFLFNIYYLYICIVWCCLSLSTLQAVGGLFVTPCCAADSPNYKPKSLKIPSFTTSRSWSRRGHRAAEFPLKLSRLCHLPAPPALSPFLLSFFTLLLDSFLCLPLFTPLFPFYISSCSLLPIGFSYSWGL